MLQYPQKHTKLNIWPLPYIYQHFKDQSSLSFPSHDFISGLKKPFIRTIILMHIGFFDWNEIHMLSIFLLYIACIILLWLLKRKQKVHHRISYSCFADDCQLPKSKISQKRFNAKDFFKKQKTVLFQTV